MAVFLASSRGRNITGQTINVQRRVCDALVRLAGSLGAPACRHVLIPCFGGMGLMGIGNRRPVRPSDEMIPDTP